jgi:hypothetical protein
MARQASRRSNRRERGGSGCLNALAALLFVAALLVLIYVFAVRPMLSRAVADQLAGPEPTFPVPTLMPAGAPPPPPPTAQPLDQIVEQAGALVPSAVDALPRGELVISEADINGVITARPDAIAPLEGATVRLTPGTVRAEVRAFGVGSGVTMGLAAQDGQVVVTNVQVDAPLSLVISGDEVASRIVGRINAELAARGRRVDDLRVEEGQLVVVTS